jgi:cysteine synthase A
VDVDFRMTARGPEFFEFSPRLGGNWVPQLLRRATGVDLIDNALDLALGLPISVPQVSVEATAIELLFSPSDGVVSELPVSQEEADAEVVWLIGLGDEVKAPRASADQIGYVVAVGRSAGDARTAASRIASACLTGLRVSS